eukprot:COSAG06_NODE_2903_length_6116_cov_16.107861_1_plen_73_part_00
MCVQRFSLDVDELLSRPKAGDGASGVPDILVVLGSGERPSSFKYQLTDYLEIQRAGASLHVFDGVGHVSHPD